MSECPDSTLAAWVIWVGVGVACVILAFMVRLYWQVRYDREQIQRMNRAWEIETGRFWREVRALVAARPTEVEG